MMTFIPTKIKKLPCLPIKVVPSDEFRIGCVIDVRKRFCWVPTSPPDGEEHDSIVPYWPCLYYVNHQEMMQDIGGSKNDTCLFLMIDFTFWNVEIRPHCSHNLSLH